jgi:hypothetical protein
MPDQLQQVTLAVIEEPRQAEEARPALAQALGGTVGAIDDGGLLDVEVEAASHEEALARVRDAIAAAGVDHLFTFPETTGTEYHPPGHRAPDPDEEPDDDDEPPHLQLGSPHENEPEPYDEPPRDVP